MRDKKREILGLLSLALIGLAGCAAITAQQKKPKEEDSSITKYTNTDFAMGTVVSETVYSSGEDRTASYVQRLKEIENNLISWRVEGSEIDQINQSAGKEQGAAVSEETAGYLAQLLQLSDKSEGKLDPTLGKLSRLWNIDGEDAKEEVPSAEEIEELLQWTGYEKIRQEGNRVWLPEHVSLDLGAVGKGIGCDEVWKMLKEEKEVSGAVISVGGSVFTYGKKENGSPWTVAISHPRSGEGNYLGTISIEGEKFISTSGDYEKYFMKDGKRYHHILDPDTGWPSESGLVSVTVLCDSGLIADGLSTACFVLGKDKALKLLEEYGAEGILVDEEQRIFVTEGVKEAFDLLDGQYQIEE